MSRVLVIYEICFLTTFLLPVSYGQITWTGNGNDGLWTTANNWSGGSLPTGTDDVVLDNTYVHGSYTVIIPILGTAIARTVQLGYSENTDTITLAFLSNAIVDGFKFGNGMSGNLDFSIDQGGVFINASNAPSGSTYFSRASSSDSIRVQYGGKFIHVTERSFSIPFPAATTIFDPGSTFELNVRGTTTAVPTISGRTWGNYVIAADSGNGSRSYAGASGAGLFTVANTWMIKPGVTLGVWTTTGTHTVQNIDFNSPMSYGAATSTLQVSGNITTNAAWTTSPNQIMTLNGTSIQEIGGSFPITFAGSVTLNNSHGIVLHTNIAVHGMLTLAEGIITTNTSTLTISSAGTISRTNGYVYGTLQKQEITGTQLFEVGTSHGYTPVTICVVGSDDFAVTTIEERHPMAGANSLSMYWNLSAGTGITSADLIFQYLPSDIYGTELLYDLARWNGSIWETQNIAVDPVAHIAMKNGVTSFSDWTIGEVDALPVQLISFSATRFPTGISLMWKTATETACYGFELERSNLSGRSGDDKSWIKVGFIQGAGSSNAAHHYDYFDQNVVTGSYGYRLKQIDQGGNFRYCGNIEVKGDATPQEVTLSNYPNPFNPMTTVVFSVPGTGPVRLKVFNTLGQEVATVYNGVAESCRYYSALFNGAHYASGVYYYRLEFKGRYFVNKMLMVQ
jgi:hypothetical protein